MRIRDWSSGGCSSDLVHEAAEPSEAVAAIARKMGFDAYGLSKDMPDPVANAMSTMFDHVQRLDERLVQICRLLHEMDSRMPELALSKLADRTRVMQGRSGSVRVALRGRRSIKKKKKHNINER